MDFYKIQERNEILSQPNIYIFQEDEGEEWGAEGEGGAGGRQKERGIQGIGKKPQAMPF